MKNNGDITPALIVKLILVLVFLLTTAFVSGVVIGKNGSNNNDRTSSDEEGINEKLSICIFNSDELRSKYLKLRDAAREKGLVDENDVINMKIMCSVEEPKPKEKSAEPEPVEPESVETPPVETFHETSLQKPAKPAEKKLETPPETSPKKDKNRTIDEILNEKGAPKKENPNKETVKKCLFSIQIFAANTKEQADAAAKKLKTLKPRIVGGEDSKGKIWYKLRTGCFDSREAAETELANVKKSEKSAYIVSE